MRTVADRPPRGKNGKALRVAPSVKPGHGVDTRQLTLDLDIPITALPASRAGSVGAAIGLFKALKSS
jgi:hypothetical protein